MTQSASRSSTVRDERPSWMVFVLCGWAAIVSIFGGTSQNAPLSDFIVQLASAGMLVVMIWNSPTLRMRPAYVGLIAAAVATIGLVGWQLLPLPGDMASAFPGRAAYLADLKTLGVDASFVFASIDTTATLHALLFCLPLLAAVAVVVGSPLKELRLVMITLVVMGAVSVILGGIQLAGGDSGFATFKRSNGSIAQGYGYFPNRNHWAVYLACLAPLALWCWMTEPSRLSRGSKRSIGLMALASLALMVVVGIAVSGSRAGLLFLAVSFAVSGICLMVISRNPHKLKIAAGTVVVALLVVVAIWLLDGWAAIARFSSGGELIGRGSIWREVIPAVQTYWPVGSGGDTLSRVMLAHEGIKSIDATFINRAHNEYIAIALEHGLAGVILTGLGLIGLLYVVGLRVTQVLTRDDLVGKRTTLVVQIALFVLPIVILLTHTIFDYPLRTPLIGVIFVFLSCMLVLGRTVPVKRSAEG